MSGSKGSKPHGSNQRDAFFMTQKSEEFSSEISTFSEFNDSDST